MTRRLFLLSLLAALPVLNGSARADDVPPPVRVVVWDERQQTEIKPYGGFLGDYLAAELGKRPGIVSRSVGIDEPEQGLSDEVLDSADVLIWWGHVRHREISTETARRILDRVREGRLSLVVLHSALSSRPFIEAMHQRSRIDAALALADVDASALNIQLIDTGPEVVRPKGAGAMTPSLETNESPGGVLEVKLTLPACSIGSWREDSKPSHVTVLRPDHPIAAGLPAAFDIPHTEMYDEPFQVPEPDVVVLHERWDAGEEFRAGCLWNLGKGKVFYFRPGHETDDVFKHAEPMLVLENATRFLAQQQTSNR